MGPPGEQGEEGFAGARGPPGKDVSYNVILIPIFLFPFLSLSLLLAIHSLTHSLIHSLTHSLGSQRSTWPGRSHGTSRRTRNAGKLHTCTTHVYTR